MTNNKLSTARFETAHYTVYTAHSHSHTDGPYSKATPIITIALSGIFDSNE